MRLDEHVRKINILIVGVSTKHTDHLRHDITYVVHLFEARHHVGKFYGNNDIGSHGLRNICRKIVSRTAVYKDHSVRTHRFEKSRDGHGGTKGSINGSAAPVLCLAAYHIRSHTHERYRKVVERHFVLIPHGKTRYLIVDIEPVRVSRRKRTHEGLLLIFLIVLLAAVKKVGCCLERYCEDIFGVVHLGGIRDIFLIHHIRKQLVPILIYEYILQFISLVPYSIQTTQQASDTRTADQVYRDIQFFYEFKGSHLRRSLGSTSGKHKSHCRAPFRRSDTRHLRAHLPEVHAVYGRLRAVHGKVVGIYLIA